MSRHRPLFHAGERLSYRHALHANGTRHRPSRPRPRSSVVSARIVRIGDVSSQAFTTTILCCLGTHCTHRGCLVTGLHDHDPLLSRHALYASGMSRHRPSRPRSSVVSARIVRIGDVSSQAFTTTILCCLGTHCTHRGCLVTGLHDHDPLLSRHALYASGMSRHRPSRPRSSVVSARIVRIGDVSSQAVVPRWRTSVVSARIARKRDLSQAFTTTILCLPSHLP